jgi:hypothetical protein
MKKAKTLFNSLIIGLPIVFLLIQGCNILDYDGDEKSLLNPKGGYFYMLERSSNSLIMMDAQLRELKRWELTSTIEGTSTQGITFDGQFLWISSSGSMDKIFKVDASGDTLVVIKSIDAPPQKQGVVRDIAWDGNSLWVLNSGSSTYKNPATLYELNPVDGSIRSETVVPSPEPRALSFVNSYTDVYNRGPIQGLYYSDVDEDYIYSYRYDRPFFDTLYSTPTPPRGTSTRYIVGLTHDGANFWLVNSSDVSDILYKISYNGKVLDQFALPYSEPGPIVWSDVDIRKGSPPVIYSISPNTGLIGSTLDVEVYGNWFKPGAKLSADFGVGITTNSVNFISNTQLRVNITISANTSPGKRDVVIINPDGVQARLDSAFEVTQTLLTPYLWVADQALGQRYLYKIRLTDTTVVQEWPTTDITNDGMQGVAYDGTDIWLCASGSSRTIYKVDVSGSALGLQSSFPAPVVGGTLRGMTFENNYLWLAVSKLNSAGYIFKIDPLSGAAVDTIQTPGDEVRGIIFVSGQLYCNDIAIDSVFSYNNLTKTWTSQFVTPTPIGGTTSNRYATGLAHDGQSFWIANSNLNFDQIFNVSSTGTILRYFDAPRKGTAQITGIVYTLLN